MRFLHISDLHLGKRVNEFSMLEDQEHILAQICELVAALEPDGVLIAGDIYDKPVPPAAAVSLFDSFLTRLVQQGTVVLMIGGNHDSAERLAFGAELLRSSRVYVAPVFDGADGVSNVQPIRLAAEGEQVDVYLLPFVKPVHVRPVFPDSEISSYNDAIRTVVESLPLDRSVRNILVAHQFVTGAVRSESEELAVGGLDNVDAELFAAFDYVALGHIHGPQTIGRPAVRYSGTPLKYSFSEAAQAKSVTMVELGQASDLPPLSVLPTVCHREEGLTITTLPLKPLRDLRELRGSYDELTLRSSYESSSRDDYIHITLTDEEDVPDAISKLRVIYPRIMKLDYDNRRTRSNQEINGATAVERKTPLELFAEFYEIQNNGAMSDEQQALAAELIEKIWEV